MKKPVPDSSWKEYYRSLYAHDVNHFAVKDGEGSIRASLQYSRRITLMQETIHKLPNVKRILDVGCAQGNLSLLLAEQGYSVTANDYNPEALEYMMLKYEYGNIELVPGNIEELNLPENSFDMVIFGEVIEHVAYPQNILEILRKLIRPEGYILITTPNHSFYRNISSGMPNYRSIKDFKALESLQFKPDADGHLFLFNRDELIKIIEDSGYSIIKHQLICTPFLYHFLFLPLFLRQQLNTIAEKSPYLGLGHLVIAQKT
jgi:2-polyprenyl-3-methyl-5-hydroxy-6-metoxy-1,4-benzoquinol methylase